MVGYRAPQCTQTQTKLSMYVVYNDLDVDSYGIENVITQGVPESRETVVCITCWSSYLGQSFDNCIYFFNIASTYLEVVRRLLCMSSVFGPYCYALLHEE